MNRELAYIFSGGRHYPGNEFYKNISNAYVICADSGLDSALLEGIKVDLVLGDLDSVSSKAMGLISKKEITFLETSYEDSMTDTELAIEYAISNGFKKICVINPFGSRVDHSMSNLMNLLKYEDYDLRLVNPFTEAFLINKPLRLENEDCIVSILPVSDSGIEVSLEGFEYETKKISIEKGSSLALSNKVIKDTGLINLSKGLAILIKSWEENI